MENYRLLLEYAKQNYHRMFRQPEGRLQHKFIVPGSCYDNCLWDWDSWLTNVALRQFVTEDIAEYEKGCILNFLEHTDAEGRIPIVILPDAVMPDLSAGDTTNAHKPCLAQHAAFLVKNDGGDAEWMRPCFEKLLRFVRYYYGHCRHQTGLYFWLDDFAIGVDNDPCTFFRPRKSSASIFLNCMMYRELTAVCFLGRKLGVDVTFFQAEAAHLKEMLQTHCYDEKDGFYYSADLNLLPVEKNAPLHAGAPRHWDCLIQRIGCWSGFLAMWSGIATPEQADRMVRENLLDINAFWAPFGVRSLSRYEKMYVVKASNNPSCWLGPVWGITNYLVFRGLVQYGYETEAAELAEKTICLFGQDLRNSGVLHEYYDPETGVPVIHPGFQNWNLLAVNMGAWLHGETVISE